MIGSGHLRHESAAATTNATVMMIAPSQNVLREHDVPEGFVDGSSTGLFALDTFQCEEGIRKVNGLSLLTVVRLPCRQCRGKIGRYRLMAI